MRETWYVLQDGTFADPAEVSPDEGGILRHQDGREVAYTPHGPRSRSMSAEEMAAYRKRSLQPEKPARGYRTRGL